MQSPLREAERLAGDLGTENGGTLGSEPANTQAPSS